MLIVDAETRELRFSLTRGLANGFAFRVELPYRQTSAGSLDGFIDNWHDIFGLPEGARPTLPRDALQISYSRDGSALIDEHSSRSGIGDLSLQLGKQIGSSPFAVWASLKLPTGDAERFTGSGSVDLTTALAIEHAFGGRYAVFAQAAGTWLGDGDRLPTQQKDIAWSGLAGISARVFDDITLTAQIDAHTALYESELDFMSETVMLTVGGSYRLSDRWHVSFAVTEDIAVESTSDVVFLFEIKRTGQN